MECLAAQRPQEAAKFIAKLPKVGRAAAVPRRGARCPRRSSRALSVDGPKEERVQFYLKAGKYNEALETAATLKSEEAFDTIVEFGEKRVRFRLARRARPLFSPRGSRCPPVSLLRRDAAIFSLSLPNTAPRQGGGGCQGPERQTSK